MDLTQLTVVNCFSLFLLQAEHVYHTNHLHQEYCRINIVVPHTESGLSIRFLSLIMGKCEPTFNFPNNI